MIKNKERDELISDLTATQKLLIEWQQLQKEYDRYHAKPIPFRLRMRWWIHLILYVAVTAISHNIYGYLLFLLLWVLINFFGVMLKKQLFKKRIKQIRVLQNDIFAAIQSESVVPQHYWNLYAVGAFLEYVTDARADTIKECVNLYETDLRHQEQMNVLRNIQINQEQELQQLQQLNNIEYDIERNTYRTYYRMGEILREKDSDSSL